MIEIYDEIEALKAREDATILAHYYQDGEIQDLADFTGDSLKLARAATTVKNRTIVFCGVHFMAETAKMLNPEKRVLLPDLQAGCSLAESCPAPLLARRQAALRAEGRKFQTVTYINSSAAVKALSDWVVTSGNAQEIIRRVPEEYEILFVPDKHLGQYLQEVTGRPMILWNGSCMVHEVFSVQDILRMKRKLPRRSRSRTRSARRTSASTATSSVAPRACSSSWTGTPSRPTSWSRPSRTCSGSSSTRLRDTATTRCPVSPAPATSARTWPATHWRSCATAWPRAAPRSPGSLNSSAPVRSSSAAC